MWYNGIEGQCLKINPYCVRTQSGLVQEVQLRVEGVDLWVFLLDDVNDEMQQGLFTVCRFGVQQLWSSEWR